MTRALGPPVGNPKGFPALAGGVERVWAGRRPVRGGVLWDGCGQAEGRCAKRSPQPFHGHPRSPQAFHAAAGGPEE